MTLFRFMKNFFFLVTVADAFSLVNINNNNNVITGRRPSSSTTTTSTSLYAIGALAKKAKEMDLRKYVEGGIEDSVKEKIKLMKEGLKSGDIDLFDDSVGPLQEALTRRRGTITVIAEYKRKMSALEKSGYIKEMFDPEILSPTFREFGASGIAVMADERMGGCTYEDLKKFAEEQRRAQYEVPGPVPIINNDLIIDELQIARSAAYGVAAAVVALDVVGEENLVTLLKCCRILNVEGIVSVSSTEEAQKAVDLGAKIILVNGIEGAEEKAKVIAGLTIPENRKVCTIANVYTQNDKQLQEIEEAWALRDKGFNCAWVGEALYKSGNTEAESPGAIIQTMKSKSSLKWASPKARSGRGEGAREYLGDILM